MTAQTLPQWATEWGEQIDALRKLVRADPELRQLGSLIGPTRVFSAAEADQIRKAYARKRAQKKAREVAAAK